MSELVNAKTRNELREFFQRLTETGYEAVLVDRPAALLRELRRK